MNPINIYHILAVYILFTSMIGFALMGIDKRKAKKSAWRISERTLILVAFVGGGIGSFLGMRVFRHKTKHAKFAILLPFTAILYAIIIYKLITLF